MKPIFDDLIVLHWQEGNRESEKSAREAEAKLREVGVHVIALCTKQPLKQEIEHIRLTRILPDAALGPPTYCSTGVGRELAGQVVLAAKRSEREACAEIASKQIQACLGDEAKGMCFHIAEDIRARSESLAK